MAENLPQENSRESGKGLKPILDPSRTPIAIVAFFFIGYLTTPFFVLLTQEFKDLIVAFIFFFGAIYVLITIGLVHKIIIVMKGE